MFSDNDDHVDDNNATSVCNICLFVFVVVFFWTGTRATMMIMLMIKILQTCLLFDCLFLFLFLFFRSFHFLWVSFLFLSNPNIFENKVGMTINERVLIVSMTLAECS